MRNLDLRPNTKGGHSGLTAANYQKTKVLNENPFEEAIEFILNEQKEHIPTVLDKLRAVIKKHRTSKRIALLNEWYGEVSTMLAALKAPSMSETVKKYLQFIEKSLAAALASNREEPLPRYDVTVARIYDQW